MVTITKESWRKFPFWLKEEIIAEVIYIIVTIVLIPFGNLGSDGTEVSLFSSIFPIGTYQLLFLQLF